MPALNNIKLAAVCDENKKLLTVKQLVNERGFINLSSLDSKEKKDFLDQFYENERSNFQYIKGNYLKQKYKAKYTITFLVAALALLATGIFLTSLFITSPITIPILPILLAGITIIAFTRFYFNKRLSRLETKMLNSEIILNSLRVDAESNENEVDMNRKIQSIKDNTSVMNEKLDTLTDNNRQSFSELLAKIGTFSTATSSISPNEMESNHSPIVPL